MRRKCQWQGAACREEAVCSGGSRSDTIWLCLEHWKAWKALTLEEYGVDWRVYFGLELDRNGNRHIPPPTRGDE